MPGLKGHPVISWKSPSSNDVWARDYLPEDIPNARILTCGYDSTLLGSESRQSFGGLGRDLLEKVNGFREMDKVWHLGTERGNSAMSLTESQTNRRPIIFVCHSLGGILIKEVGLVSGRTAELAD